MSNKNTEEFEYHCTECGAKVKESDKICPKCKSDLSEEVDETNIKLVILESFSNEFEASIAQRKLSGAKIESFIKSDNLGGARPSLTFVNHVNLMIKESDYDRAFKILKDKKTKEDFYRTRCKHCGAEVILNKKEYDEGKYICPGCFKSNKLD